MRSDAKRRSHAHARYAHGRVTAVIPIAVEESAGGERHEVLRLATGLGAYLQPACAEALAAAARSEDITPAPVEVMPSQDPADASYGVVAYVEGRMLALGRYHDIVQLGLAPTATAVHVARHIAAIGNTPFYLMVVEEDHCLGILGMEVQ